jgi:hypothetical protein
MVMLDDLWNTTRDSIEPSPFFSEELAFAPQQTFRFRYAVPVADGASDDNRAAQLAEQGQEILAASEPVA